MITPRLAIAVLLCIVPSGTSFQPASSTVLSRAPTRASGNLQVQHAAANDEVSDYNSSMSRRQIFQLATNGVMAASLLAGMPAPSLAAAPSRSDLQRLQLGHARVQYLLNNWDKLTESCNNKSMSATEAKQVVRTDGGGGGFCDKNPLVVQDYLGYKDTRDPLFKADAFMLKAVPLVNESVMDEADYVDLVEQYRDKADQVSLLAYTSSWGEANPNGSKDTTDDYLEQTKQVVVQTEGLLRKVLKALDLEVLRPTAKA